MENMTSIWVVLLKVKVCHTSPVLIQSFVLVPYRYIRHQLATFILHCTLTLHCWEIVLVAMSLFLYQYPLMKPSFTGISIR
jgi:hypothetical protein